jgi:lipoprotein
MKQIFLLAVALLLSGSCSNKKTSEPENAVNIDSIAEPSSDEVAEVEFEGESESNGIPMVKLSDNSVTYTIKDYSYKRYGGEMKELTGQDRFKLFSKKATSSEPKYEVYGQEEKITRNVKFKYPISLLQDLANGTGYDDLAGWVQQKIMLELKIPEAHEGEDETYRNLGFEESVRRWVDSVEDIDDPDFIEEDILVMPWTSNNEIVQFRIDKRTYTGGNSEFPEVKFLIFHRHGVELLSMYDVFDMWDKNLKALIYRHLNNHLQELGAEPCQPDLMLVIGEEHHIDYSYEPDGIRFWFGNGEVASHLLGIVNFTIPYNELRPYMKEDSRRYIDSFSQWHTFEPMTFVE